MNKHTIYINGRFLTQEVTGVQRVGIEISKYLQNNYGDKIIFLCPKNENIHKKHPNLNIKKIGFFKGYLWEQFELPIYLLMVKAQLLLSFCNTAPIFFNKNIIVIHDMAIRHNKNWFSWKFVLIYKILFYFNIKKAKAIITDSHFSKDEILKYYPNANKAKVIVIHLSSFISNANIEVIKGNYFLAVNSISPRKNLKVIVNAFKRLNNKEYFIKIIGGYNNKVFGKESITNYSNIEFLGNVNDLEMTGLIKNSIAVVNSSLYEGFGLPPLEAMSLGKPCILSNIPVHRELYNDVADFFNPVNENELIEKVKNLLQNKHYDSICKKSFELSQNFTWEKTAFQYIETLNNYLENNQ